MFPLTRLRTRIRSLISLRRRRHPWDVRTGLDTSGLLYADKLPTGHLHDSQNEGYYATAPSLFHGALACWRATLGGAELEEYAFLDAGCGKGRVLVMAAEYPFRSIAGVELHAGLARIARRNIARQSHTRRRCEAITVLAGDVLDLPLPEGPLVIFLFNSFSAEVLLAFVRRLSAAAQERATPIDLIYIHPDHDHLVRAVGGVEFLACSEIPFSPEDAAADIFGVSHDRCSIYRIRSQRATLEN